MDRPIPEINVPILKPIIPQRKRVSRIQVFASYTASIVEGAIDMFADWIISYVPEKVVKVVNERVELLKNQIKHIYAKKPPQTGSDFGDKPEETIPKPLLSRDNPKMSLTKSVPRKKKKSLRSDPWKEMRNSRSSKTTLRERKTALKGYLKTYRVEGREFAGDPVLFLEKNKPRVIELI